MMAQRGDNQGLGNRLVLAAEDLHKSYGPRPALRGLSFTLRAGRIMGFLGPNGAGKTTSIRILTTMMEPDSGRFMVDGISSRHPDEIRRRIGVLPETFGLPKQMTGVEYVTYYGQLYGRSASDARSRALALLEEVGLGQRARSLVGTYSHGMRQRVGIARALVNDPRVVFLDEPTLGLDPAGQKELLGLVRQIAEERSAGVVLCSHMLAEVESVCDDVVILRAGQVVARGDLVASVKVAPTSVSKDSFVTLPKCQIKTAETKRNANPPTRGLKLNSIPKASPGKATWDKASPTSAIFSSTMIEPR